MGLIYFILAFVTAMGAGFAYTHAGSAMTIVFALESFVFTVFGAAALIIDEIRKLRK